MMSPLKSSTILQLKKQRGIALSQFYHDIGALLSVSTVVPALTHIAAPRSIIKGSIMKY